MKIKQNIKIHEVAGEHIVMRVGDGKKADMTTVIAFNPSALLLMDRLCGRDFTVEDAVRVLTDKYEVDEATARKDAEGWIAEMANNGMMEQ